MKCSLLKPLTFSNKNTDFLNDLEKSIKEPVDFIEEKNSIKWSESDSCKISFDQDIKENKSQFPAG